jgi:hypothetical protein
MDNSIVKKQLFAAIGSLANSSILKNLPVTDLTIPSLDKYVSSFAVFSRNTQNELGKDFTFVT